MRGFQARRLLRAAEELDEAGCHDQANEVRKASDLLFGAEKAIIGILAALTRDGIDGGRDFPGLAALNEEEVFRGINQLTTEYIKLLGII